MISMEKSCGNCDFEYCPATKNPCKECLLETKKGKSYIKWMSDGIEDAETEVS